MDLESSELVGGLIIRYSDSKEQKIAVVCKRIEFTTTVIKFRKQ